jgi:DNA-directed RNA polymerase subunit E'
MYAICTLRETVRVPPKEFGKNLKKAILKILQEEYEGMVDESIGVIVSVLSVEEVGEGKIVPGDGAAYYDSKLSALVYKPEIQEVVEGSISEITEFGAFIRTGPIEGLIHVSQIMNDFINYDPKLPGFIGKETKKKIQLDDLVRARIVTVSLKGSIPNSKIGLTMRQLGLGKKEWIEIDRKAKEKEAKKKALKGKEGKVSKKNEKR